MWTGRTVDALDALALTLRPEARADIDRLRNTLGYAAPEIRDRILWRGSPSTLGISDLCRVYGTDETRAVYDEIFQACESHAMNKLSAFTDVPSSP